MTRVSVGLVTTLLIAVSGTALAVALRHRPGSENWTEPAGSGSDSAIDVLTTADYYGVQVLTLWDHRHRVCALQMEQTGFSTGTESVLERVKVCEPTVAETWRRADVGEGKFVTAVAACVGGSEGVLRGLEMWGAALAPNGVARQPGESARFAFEDCAWTEVRHCPWGQIATGIRIYADEGGNGIVGLALRCHRIEPR